MLVSHEVGFFGGWFGIILGVLCIVLLSVKAKQQYIQFQTEHKEDEATRKRQIFDCIFLFCHAFGCAAFTIVYCSFYATVGAIPQRLNIKLTHNLCQSSSLYQLGIAWELSRYCFYNFMLWRINATFHRPQALALSKCSQHIYVSLIHVWLIAALCVSIMGTQFTVRLNEVGECVLLAFTGHVTVWNKLAAAIFAADSLFTLNLFCLFIHRLFKLTAQNEKINRYKQKTLVFGVIATLSSIVLVVIMVSTTQYLWFVALTPIDSIINMWCVALTYKLPSICPWPPCPTHVRQHEYNHGDIAQESTTNRVGVEDGRDKDSAVMDMLFCSNPPRESLPNVDGEHVHVAETEIVGDAENTDKLGDAGRTNTGTEEE